MAEYDFTLHYRYDAAVPLMGQVKDFMPHPIPPNNYPDLKKMPWLSYEEREHREIMSVVISNCAGQNGRERVLTRMMEGGLSVASYGTCHHTKNIPTAAELPANSTTAEYILTHDKFRQKEGLASLHLFHFAAENSNCDYYHTEKIFQALRAGAVPVYMGGKTITDFVPPGSIIDVRDYESPEQLGLFLQKVAKDKLLYMQFHAWRTRPLPAFVIDKIDIGKSERTPDWYCNICKLVRTPTEKRVGPDTSCEESAY